MKTFIDWWAKTYEEKFKNKYHVVGGKDGTTVKRLLQTYNLIQLQELATRFFESKDQFIRNKAGYTLGVFAVTVNKLISADSNGASDGNRIKGHPGKYSRS